MLTICFFIQGSMAGKFVSGSGEVATWMDMSMALGEEEDTYGGKGGMSISSMSDDLKFWVPFEPASSSTFMMGIPLFGATCSYGEWSPWSACNSGYQTRTKEGEGFLCSPDRIVERKACNPGMKAVSISPAFQFTYPPPLGTTDLSFSSTATGFASPTFTWSCVSALPAGCNQLNLVASNDKLDIPGVTAGRYVVRVSAQDAADGTEASSTATVLAFGLLRGLSMVGGGSSCKTGTTCRFRYKFGGLPPPSEGTPYSTIKMSCEVGESLFEFGPFTTASPSISTGEGFPEMFLPISVFEDLGMQGFEVTCAFYVSLEVYVPAQSRYMSGGTVKNLVRVYREYAYLTESWSTCSEACGPGTQMRAVKCHAASGEEVAEEMCVGLAKPSTSKPCFMKLCDGNVSQGLTIIALFAFSYFGFCAAGFRLLGGRVERMLSRMRNFWRTNSQRTVC